MINKTKYKNQRIKFYNPSETMTKAFAEKGVDDDGLFKCFLGRRIDLCPCTDFNGKDENDAGAYNGSIGGDRSCHQCLWLV